MMKPEQNREMEKEQHTTQNITASNKDLEVLKKNFSHCFDKNGDFDFDKFKNELSEKEVNFSKESYGMDWLGKSYARLLASDNATTLLKEDAIFNAKEENKNSENLLIKGDNLEVLKHLSNAYYEKIKMIYIDPPYNTGGDGFVYQDDRKFTVNQFKHLAGVDEDTAKKILTFVDSKSNSHSAWLTFMYPRLYIAKQLLKEDGVIFVSIDDNEVAQLRLLMDEIFGEENFISKICHKSRASVSNDKIISPNHNFILLYAKKYENIHNNRLDFGLEPEIKGFNKTDEEGEYKLVPVDGPGGASKGNPFYEFEGIEGYWRFSKTTMQEKFDKGLVVKTKNNLQQKYYKKTAKDRRKTVTTWWDEKLYTSEATKKLNLLLKHGVFETPKPIELIRKMLALSTNKDDLILDFFAGSGTTGDAVMQLNADDDGDRKFILAQLPEKIDPKASKTAYDFVKNELKIAEPTIFDITKERLLRAAKKLKEENKDTKIDLGFKVFETPPIWEDYNLESDTFDEKLQLFDELQLSKEDIKALLITWKTNDGIALTNNLEEIDLGKYTGYYFEDKMYLMDKGFTTNNLKTLLELIDTNKKINPASIIAFGYHFESKNLREISENIKSYANKKNIDIDFITRY